MTTQPTARLKGLQGHRKAAEYNPMPQELQTINLKCELYPDEILILRGVHRIEPIGSYADPFNGEKYLVFWDNKTTNEVLRDVKAMQKYVDNYLDEGLDVLREYLLGKANLRKHDDDPNLEGM